MDPLAPILPSILIGFTAYLLRERLPWWSVPILVFLFLIAVQVIAIINLYSFPPIRTELFVYEPSVPLSFYIGPILLTSAYFALLSLLFTLAGLAIERALRRLVDNNLLRYVITVYIVLLLLQLWVVVFPWTVLVPYRFYSLL